ncbi:Fumarate hydratase 1, mitochondrial [Musa troglodytarum]|nr:Fumarate hydratase 1, mitochondrial [Musa troglodytarum]URE32201.1 Fumarate hydratase 1, mitochondrial [Musa troglodytarum]URE32204.1 Fumarate hydratase 1, mitochondrial [Musa troglodytarum]
MKKIMENEKLVEMAMTDPKRVKRILANRHSAARSKERKTRYIAELERKVQTLQTETTKLSTQLTFLQRDSAGLTNQNHELRFRLQAMEQQAQLRDALNEALTAEVQRLKLAATGLADAHRAKSLNQLQSSTETTG